MDFDYHIAFGQAMPPRAFSTLQQAATYVLSGLDVAQQRMAAARGAVQSSERITRLVDKVVRQIEGARSVLLDTRLAQDATRPLGDSGKQALLKRCKDACADLTSSGNTARLDQQEAETRMLYLHGRRVLAFCLIFLFIVALPTLAGVLSPTTAIGWKMLAGCMPYCFEMAWRISEERAKLRLCVLEKEAQVCVALQNTMFVLASAITVHVNPFVRTSPATTAASSAAATPRRPPV